VLQIVEDKVKPAMQKITVLQIGRVHSALDMSYATYLTDIS